MKKKRFMGFLGLLSCATLLTGCDLPAPLQSAVEWSKEHIVSPIKDLLPGEKEEKKTPVEPEPKPEPKEVSISISDELPSIAVIGSEVDLDEYVSVTNADSFAVELSEESKEFASLDGHKISFTGEGELEFTVSAGDKTAESGFYVFSELRYTLFATSYNFDCEYTAISFGNDGAIDGYVWHGEGYVMTDQWYQDEETQEVYPGGLLQFAGQDGVFMFYEVYTEGETEEDPGSAEFYPASDVVYPNMYMDYLNPEFYYSVEFADFSYVDLVTSADFTQEEAEYLKISGEDAELFAESSLLAMNGQWYFGETYGYGTCSSVYFYYEDLNDYLPTDFPKGSYVVAAEVCATFENEPGKEYWIGSYWLTDLEGFVGDDFVEEFIANPENVFAGGNYAGQLNLGNLFKAGIPYYAAFDVTFEYGWADAKGNFYDPSSEEGQAFLNTVAGTIVEDLPAYGKSGILMGSNGILTTDADGNISGGVVQKVEAVEEQEVITVYDLEVSELGAQVYENAKLADVYESPLSLSAFADSFNDKTFSFNETINYGTEDEPVYGYSLGLNSYFGYDFFDAILASESGLSKVLSTMKSHEVLYGYFKSSMTYVPSSLYMNFSSYLPFDEDGNMYLISMVFEYNGGQYEEFIQNVIASVLPQ